MTRTVPRAVIVLSIVASVVVAVQVARMSVFMARPDAPHWSLAPWNPFSIAHSCMSGYWAAARYVETQPNVWSDDLSRGPAPAPGVPRPVKRMGTFTVDSYEYTPTFLLLPRLLQQLSPEFLAFRQLWFAFNLVVVVGALAAISRRLVPATGPVGPWLAPLVLVPLATLVTFQIGNVQLACISGALLAMLAFERARAGGSAALAFGAAGGLLLAFMTMSKLYPGVLAFYLLIRRDWQAVGWTSAWGVVLLAIGLADMGLGVHLAFLDHLPALLSGEAFPPLRVPAGISANSSIPGLALKAGLYGGPVAWFEGMRVIGWIYTVVLLAVAIRLARRPLPAPWEPVAWISLLLLATLRSPVLPVYGVFPVVWLAVVVLAVCWGNPGIRLLLLMWIAVMSGITPNQTLWSPQVHGIFMTVTVTAGAIAITVAALRLARATPVSVAAASAAGR